jgi:hypothetical protein
MIGEDSFAITVKTFIRLSELVIAYCYIQIIPSDRFRTTISAPSVALPVNLNLSEQS